MTVSRNPLIFPPNPWHLKNPVSPHFFVSHGYRRKMSAPAASAQNAAGNANPATGSAGLPFSATPTQLYYANIVDVDLAQNAVNFADDLTQGHRVQINMAKADLTKYFQWNRAVGSDRPVGSFVDTGSDFNTTLAAALTNFTDLDAVASGLNLSTGVLKDSTIAGNTVNDLIAQYILYKVYGASNYDTKGTVFNIDDVKGMIDNATVSAAIDTSILDNNLRNGSVDQMFRDLLASDPKRFFDASGKQVPGLFETNADVAGSGDWKLTAGDIMEIKIKFNFKAPVTRRVVSADQQPLSSQGGAAAPTGASETSVEQEIIPSGHVFPVRLQIVLTA